MPEHADVIGLVPAAGRGKRIAPLPCSKEIFPIGFYRDPYTGELRPRVACYDLFAKFHRAGVKTAFVILRNGKWDIPAYFGDGALVGLKLAYIVIEESTGPPDTLDRAFAFTSGRCVAFGFPDILFGPVDVFDRLLLELRRSDAAVVLALYAAQDPKQSDMVDIDPDGRVRAIELKRPDTNLRQTWACAVWTPTFTAFMHEFVGAEKAKGAAQGSYLGVDAQGDLPVGAVIKAAVENGLIVRGVGFPDDKYLDIGTPEALLAVVQSAETS